MLYASGAAACSTADLLVVLESINTSLDNIEKHLNKATLSRGDISKCASAIGKKRFTEPKASSKYWKMPSVGGEWQVNSDIERTKNL